MHRYFNRQLFLNIFFSLLIFCVVELCPLIVGGFFKLIAFLAFASLLVFVVVHSANLRAVLATCLRRLSNSFRAPDVGLRWMRQFASGLILPSEPNLAVLFQRPPPVSF
jgi:hypothetical protein